MRLARLRRLPRDEHGAISLLTLVTIIGLMLLMAMVMNVGRHIDDKVRMQNAVDASAYSGGVVLARGMNAIAFSNHLLCDVFALTAYMREARDRNADKATPEILDAWEAIGPIFSRSKLGKFQLLGGAIVNKVTQERQLVKSFSEMSEAISKRVLPVLEYVLKERLIPEFQRQVVQTIPRLAQDATNEVARRQGISLNPQAAARDQARGQQVGVLWRTQGQPVAYPDELDPMARTLPAIDPTPFAPMSGNSGGMVEDPNPDPREGQDAQMMPNPLIYAERAAEARERFAKTYLCEWTCDRLRFFPVEGKMSNFFELWRAYTCGQLEKLLHTEYPQSNLPHILRPTDAGLNPIEFVETAPAPTSCDCRVNVSRTLVTLGPQDMNAYLDRNFMFVGIVYRPKFTETSPKFFRNPLDADPQTFAQISLFTPRARWNPFPPPVPGQTGSGGSIGGGFGVDVTVGGAGGGINPFPSPPAGNSGQWFSDGSPFRWDLWNQNWCIQLVPATTNSLAGLLTTAPPAGVVNTSQPVAVKVPNFGGASSLDLRHVNNH